ncbi:MAG: NifU family protein [Gracilibacteraceae bacterium]|nr:NifU family protein [Gracilibacteraceae bacterium]
MQRSQIRLIEKILAEKVRPALQVHGGDLTWEEIRPTDKRLRIRFLGACSSCSAATSTVECIVEEALKEVWPDFQGVELENGVSREFLLEARRILALDKERNEHGKKTKGD